MRARVRLAHGRSARIARGLRVLSAAVDPATPVLQPPMTEDAGFAALDFQDLADRRLVGGAPISGVVTVVPLETGSAREVRVELVLAEHVPPDPGHFGEEDRGAQMVVASVPLIEHVDLRTAHALWLPFTLEFTLRWLLRALLDRPLRRDPHSSLELLGTTAT